MASLSLAQLLKDLPGIDLPESLTDLAISEVSTDPNLCKPGVLYLAAECETVDSQRYGLRLDGHDFIDLAIRNGASAVVVNEHFGIQSSSRVPFIRAERSLAILGLICSRLYADRPRNIALVTGTNGKTSTVNFSKMLWHHTGHSACSVGNLGGVCADGSIVWERDSTLSVPETVTLHKILRTLAERKVDYLAMEATSHALFDYRLDGISANIAAFTNLTSDHLDFHGSMEEYFRVKMMLFDRVLSPGSFAILNADSDWFSRAEAVCISRKHKILSYGRNGRDLRILESRAVNGGQLVSIEVLGRRYECRLNLYGEFQLSNVLCSLGIVIASGIPEAHAIEKISFLQEVEGRLNLVGQTERGGQIIVDYAHTPDGLRAALEACRTFTRGKLWVAFGCGGERDKGKRPVMGEIATRLADRVIVTDDNPRFEDPAIIRAEILAQAAGAREIAERRKAIEYGIEQLNDGDTLLIAGFGHEKFQSVKGQLLPFSDTEIAKSLLESGRRMASPLHEE
jgi:UDP-N-acetylmuramoyl-L-alanyl-D-glutamate--2,6-diaminopimelate ligase